MGDCLLAGKPFAYVTTHLGRLSLLPLWDGKMSTGISFQAE